MSKRELRKSLRTDFNPDLKLRMIRAAHRLRRASHLPALLAGVALDRPIFVIGAPRSGTSLLYAVLRSSKHVAHWPGEAHEVWEADHHPALRGWESNVLTADDVSPEAAARIRRRFFLVTGRRRRLIDKTPRNCFRVGFVDTLFPDARFVFLKRDGRDNVNSLINAWRTPRYRTYRLPEPHSIPGVDPVWWKFVLYPGWKQDAGGPLEVVCAKQWKLANTHAVEGLEEVDTERTYSLRYEDLVADPVGEIGNVLEFVGVPYDDAVRRKAAATRTTTFNIVTPPEPGKWRRENPAEIDAITPLIAPTMRSLGYEVEEASR